MAEIPLETMFILCYIIHRKGTADRRLALKIKWLQNSRSVYQTRAAICVSYHYLCFRWRIRDRSRSGISQALKSILQSSTSTQPSLQEIKDFFRFPQRGFYVNGGSQSLRRGQPPTINGSTQWNSITVRQEYQLIHFLNNESNWLYF